jgi:hypothetical protein
MAAPAKKEEISVNQAPTNIGSNLVRTTFGQGLLFGFGDEVEAFARSLVEDKSYEELLPEIRGQIKQFREEAPVAAYGSEILGAIPSTIATGGSGLLGKLGLKGAGKIAATQGGVYGAGAGEDLESRAKGAALGSVLAGTTQKLADKVLPKVTQEAKKLKELGVNVTPGQRVKGSNVIGDVVGQMEEGLTTYPGVAGPIQKARLDSMKDFNRSVVNKVLDPLDVKVPASINSGDELAMFIKDTMDTKYDEVLGSMKLKSNKFLNDDINNILQNSTANEVDLSSITKTIDKKVLPFLKDGKNLDGQDLKRLESTINGEVVKFKNAVGTQINAKETLEEVLDRVRTEINLQNPGTELNKVNAVYNNVKPIYKAISRGNARVDQTFSPAQYRQSLMQNDITANKLKTLAGDRPTSELLNLSEKVIGPTLGDSGTAARLLMQDVASSPISTVSKKFAVPGILSDLAYSQVPLVPGNITPLQLLIETPSSLLTKPLPAYSGIISQNEELQKLLDSMK